MSQQFESPSDDFVRFLVSEIYEGVRTKAAIEKFTPIIKRGLKQIVNEQVNDKLSAALKSTNESKVIIEEEQEDEAVVYEGGIITTEEELESYAITKVAFEKERLIRKKCFIGIIKATLIY